MGPTPHGKKVVLIRAALSLPNWAATTGLGLLDWAGGTGLGLLGWAGLGWAGLGWGYWDEPGLGLVRWTQRAGLRAWIGSGNDSGCDRYFSLDRRNHFEPWACDESSRSIDRCAVDLYSLAL